jgi:16S rRNA (cytosine967-C5)-methyltransferase
MISPARTASLHALRAITARRDDLPAALARSRTRLSDERDRALTAEIVTGTLRWQRSLDHLIEHYARRPAAKLDADVLTILRLSIYQLLHLDRVPASAVVDDAVNLARAVRKPSAAGFVNAVLRSLLRQRHRLPLPGRPEIAAGLKARLSEPSAEARHHESTDAALRYLGITHSHPDWLVARWLHRYGFEATEAWVRFNNETPALTLRANRLHASRDQVRASLAADGIETEPTRYAPDGLTVTAGNPLRLSNSGAFFVQDEASQLVSLAVAVRPHERVLDLCASPGGKTTAMAADMGGTGLIVASDIRPRRVELLRDAVRSSGASNIHVIYVPDSGELPFARPFDRVLVDAPCSGLGTIRRDPDIRWRRTEGDLSVFARGQLQLLHRAAAVVKPGGRLAYATCSSEPEENEQVVERFLQEHPGFTTVDLHGESAVLDTVLDGAGCLHTLPFLHGLEAFFAAAIERRP